MKMLDHNLQRRVLEGLWAISGEGSATVEGVIIDLRHSELSPDLWFCSQVQRWSLTLCPSIDNPALIFPWNDRSSYEDRIQAWSREIEDNPEYPELNGAREKMREPAKILERANLIRTELDREIVVEQGDRLQISHVVTVPIGDVLEHPSDREKRLGYLEIIKADGAKISVAEPLLFFRRSSFKSSSRARQLSFNTIVARICEENGIQNLFSLCLCAEQLAETIEEYSSEKVELTWAEGLLENAQKLAVELEAIASRIEGAAPDYSEWAQTSKARWWLGYLAEKTPQRSDVESLFNGAVALGYQWKQYEADMLMRTPAQAGITVAEGRKRGGERRGEHLRSEARTIREVILELARQYREREPSLSQEELATKICDLRRKAMPAHRTVVGHISMLEKSGDLRKKSRR